MPKDQVIELPYGLTKVECRIPKDHLRGVYSPKPKLLPPEDLENKLLNAMKTSMATSINRLSNKSKKIAIATSDRTRSTPNDRILPILLDQLNTLGLKDDDIRIIIAGGLHAPSYQLDVEANVGDKVLRRVHVTLHNPNEELVQLGKTSLGTPLYINSEFAKSDINITIGNIVPCNLAGWTGGSKTILPGVSGTETIRKNHMLFIPMIKRLDRCSLAGTIDNNIVRADMEECGKLVGHDIIINTILSPENELIDIVVGDPIKAHRVGVKIAFDSLSQRIPTNSDIILACTGNYNFETSLFQGISRVLQALDRIVKPGGYIVVLCESREGFCEGAGKDTFKEQLKKLPSPEELLTLAKAEKICSDVCPPLYIISWFVHILKTNLIVISHNLSEEDMGYLKIIKPDDLQETIDKIVSHDKEKSRVTVIPHASITLPIIS